MTSTTNLILNIVLMNGSIFPILVDQTDTLASIKKRFCDTVNVSEHSITILNPLFIALIKQNGQTMTTGTAKDAGLADQDILQAVVSDESLDCSRWTDKSILMKPVYTTSIPYALRYTFQFHPSAPFLFMHNKDRNILDVYEYLTKLTELSRSSPSSTSLRHVRRFDNAALFQLSGDGSRLITRGYTTDHRNLVVWDISPFYDNCNDWNQISIVTLPKEASRREFGVSYDGSLVATSHVDPVRVEIRSTKTDKLLHRIPGDQARNPTFITSDCLAYYDETGSSICFYSLLSAKGSSNGPRSSSFLSAIPFLGMCGNQLVALTSNGVALCTPGSRKAIYINITTHNYHDASRLSPCGNYFIFLNHRRHLVIVDLLTQTHIDRGIMPPQATNSKAMSPDGSYLVLTERSHVGDENINVILWSIDD